jgi:hypothetical protein
MSTRTGKTIGLILIGIGTIGSLHIAWEMHQNRLFPWQIPRAATIQAPKDCEAIVYSTPPSENTPKCQPTKGEAK